MKSGSGSGSQSGGRRRKADAILKLVRVEPAGKTGLSLVFEGNGEEKSWRLEHTSITEFLALLLRGRMHRGRRVFVADADLTFEPGDMVGDDPKLCIAAGPLELCAPVDRAGVKALKADMERSLRR
jgi:hypothetical protein